MEKKLYKHYTLNFIIRIRLLLYIYKYYYRQYLIFIDNNERLIIIYYLLKKIEINIYLISQIDLYNYHKL